MHHPLSSYVPFFVFVITLVVIVVIIVLLVGRLLAMLGGPGAPPATPGPAPRHTATAVAAGTATAPARRPGAGAPARSALLPVAFATTHDTTGQPVHPTRAFAPSAPRIYAIATLPSVAAGAPIHFVWVYGPHQALLADVPEHSQGPAYTLRTFLSYYIPDSGIFATGRYTVTVTLAGQTVARGAFTVRPP